MYHTIHPTTEKNRGYLEITTDIKSFEGVLSYLVENDYYFPTPLEIAEDIKTGICRHKYAIITIDDSWNDPEKMGVTEVLGRYRSDPTKNGNPKVWFAVSTRQLSKFTSTNGEEIDPWVHFSEMNEAGLVYVISHSQTHPQLVNTADLYSKENNRIYKQIGDELLPSRKDILWGLGQEPLFFVYPGGNVASTIIDRISGAGYVGAFTVWPGSLDKSMPYYLPRLNGGARCGAEQVDNSFCVIEMIEKFANK